MVVSADPRQTSFQSGEPNVVTLWREGTSQEFGRLIRLSVGGGQGAIFVSAGSVVISEAGTIAPSQLQWPQGMPEATAALRWRLRGMLAVTDACQEFAKLLRQVPEVQSVVSSDDDGIVHVWTYLDANPFDEATRDRVYEAEEEILDRYPDAEIDFHLVNLAEYPAGMNSGLRKAGTVLHERRPYPIQDSTSPAGD